MIETSCFQIAQRYVGLVHEFAGERNHPLIQWWFSLCGYAIDTPDEIPWCSAFMNGIAWELRLPRSKSAAARSWLLIGTPININDAIPENDVVILKRGGTNEPGPEVIKAQGHVGFFAGIEDGRVLVLGGNQGDEVNISGFPIERVLGVRRLA